MTPPLRIGDLVELPEVRTVVQIADARDAALSARLLDDFVLTGDCDVALTTLLESLRADSGQGFFLQGHYGSGKSHLFAVLHLLLCSAHAWDALLARLPDAARRAHYAELRRALQPPSAVVASVSLVEHAAGERLEDVAFAALEQALRQPLGFGPGFAADARALGEIRSALEARHAAALEAFLAENQADRERLFDPRRPDLLDALVRRLDLPFRVRRGRQEFLDALAQTLVPGGARRAVLILDELSEFLRSEPDARAFREDVRFLQFLGEASRRLPLWICASLQEQIESTGEIDQTTFARIKDRYPVRLSLTTMHLRELVSARLVRRKPATEAPLRALWQRLQRSFHTFSLSADEFLALYPLHPATLELLDDLLPLFSRHRGAVDFIHYQLTGDPARRIEGRLARPAHELLGPDAIFDHFRVRLGETLESAPFVSVVVAFYERELRRLFPDASDRALALRLVKVLVLQAVSPLRRRRTVAQLAEMMLEPVSDLDPAANVDRVHDLLDRMQREGAYVGVEEGAQAAHPHERVYRIDLAADARLIVERRLAAFVGDPGFTPARALELLLPALTQGPLPLAHLAAAPRGTRRASWQRTRREGLLLFARGADDPLVSADALADAHERLASGEPDFLLIVLGPTAAEADADELLTRLSVVDPEGLGAAAAALVWCAAPLGPDDVALVRRAAARLLVREHYKHERSETAERVRAALEPAVAEEAQLVHALVQRAYREGRFLFPSVAGGGVERPGLAPADLPAPSFERLLERLAALPLERRFPRHYRVAPAAEPGPGEPLDGLIRGFFRPGQADARESSDALRALLETQVKPLGLAKRTATGYRLQADPHESEAVRALVERAGAGQVALDALYHELRKGPLGLPRFAFDLAVLALVFSGQATAYAKGRRVALDTLDARALQRVDALGPGEMLPRAALEVLARLPFVPPRLREGGFGFAQQRELWELAVEWKIELERRLDGVRAELERAASYRASAHLDLAALRARVERLGRLVAEVKVSYAPREGLERLARAVREEPEAARLFDDGERLVRFFSEEWERYLFIRKYLADAALDFPTSPAFEALGEARDRLRALSARPGAPLDGAIMASLQEEFQAFVAVYGEAYEREHRRWMSPERVEGLTRVRAGRAYDLLRRLSEIRLLAVPDDRVRIDRLIDGALARTCARFSPELLRARPACECGFHLGHEEELPAAAEAEQSAARGVRQYLEALREPEYGEKLAPALYALAEVGKGALAERVRRLLALDLDSPRLLDEAGALVDREVTAAIDQALAGTSMLVTRTLEDLADALLERSFPKARLLALVERWIDAEAPLGADDYVKVVSRRRPAAAEDAWHAHLERGYPELVAWRARVGEADALRAVVRAFRAPGAPAGDDVTPLEALTPPRGEPFARGADEGVLPLLGEAFTAFVEAQPEDAARLLDRAEAALSPPERERVLRALPDEPGELARAAAGERAFRCVVSEAAARLLRRLVAGGAPLRLGPPPAPATDLPEALARRLGSGEFGALLGRLEALQRAQARVAACGPDGPADAGAWERLYVESLAPAERDLAALVELVRALAIDERVDLAALTAPARQTLARAGAAFERFYLAAVAAWSAGEATLLPLRPPARPVKLLADLFGELHERYARRLAPSDVLFVFLDGLRWDVWTHLEATLLPSLEATFRVVDEVPLWSLHPTTTEVQLRAAGLRLPDAAQAGDDVPRARAAPASRRPERLPPGFVPLVGPGGERVARLNLVDDKAHESSADLGDLLREIELRARRTLAVLLDETPRGGLVYLFGDHGFRQDPAWRSGARHARPRYTHGGASPWEVITPLVVLWRT
jgi:hypothetical protein